MEIIFPEIPEFIDYSLTIEPTNVPAKKRDKDEDKQIVSMTSDITPATIMEAWKLSCPAWDGKINFLTRNHPHFIRKSNNFM